MSKIKVFIICALMAFSAQSSTIRGDFGVVSPNVYEYCIKTVSIHFATILISVSLSCAKDDELCVDFDVEKFSGDFQKELLRCIEGTFEV